MDTFLLCAGNDTKHAGFLIPPYGQLILTIVIVTVNVCTVQLNLNLTLKRVSY